MMKWMPWQKLRNPSNHSLTWMMKLFIVLVTCLKKWLNSVKTGQSAPADKGSIIRIVMESLALKYRSSVEGLEEIVGNRVPALHIVGGGCKNTVLSQYTADVLNRPITAGPIEATAIGNVMSQLIALKEIEDVKQAREVVKGHFRQKSISLKTLICGRCLW